LLGNGLPLLNLRVQHKRYIPNMLKQLCPQECGLRWLGVL